MWVAAACFGAISSYVLLHRFYSQKFYKTTGEAEWIWIDRRLSSGDPVAFFATRNFSLPGERAYVRIKVAGDPGYMLYFNGREIGGGRPTRFGLIDVYDVTKDARESGNRIVVAMRSANGVGGLLVGVDLAPTLENYIVSDATWRLFARWTPEILVSDPPGVNAVKLRSLGIPPMGRWDYLSENAVQQHSGKVELKRPRSESRFNVSHPAIRVVSGVAVATRERRKATAFDFGPVRGRGRLEFGGGTSRVVDVRYVTDPSDILGFGDIQSFVTAEGEHAVTDAESHSFRYLVVYDTRVTASVLVEATDTSTAR